MNVQVVFLPPIATELPTKLCVVIDVLRATSTLVSMFEAGATRVVLSESYPAALEYAAAQAGSPAVCGESGGLPPAGFDFGNSPREFPTGSLAEREAVFCTSNGTRAMRLVAPARVVLAGSLLNASAVARAALREAWKEGLDIALICSGDILGTKFAIDDAFCAGHLLSLLRREASILDAQGEPVSAPAGTVATPMPGANERPTLRFEESAIAAERMYRSYLPDAAVSEPGAPPPAEAVLAALWESHNAEVLRQVGLEEDVVYCAQLDISRRIPRLRVEDGRLVLYDEGGVG